MKKLKKWGKRIFLGLLVLLFLAVLTGLIYEQISRSNFNKKFKPAGQLVDVGGHQLHFVSKGTGSPTVVFEAGLDAAGGLAWRAVHLIPSRSSRKPLPMIGPASYGVKEVKGPKQAARSLKNCMPF
jgi:hypothetical protein